MTHKTRRQPNDRGQAAASALVAVFLFATFGAVLLTMTLVSRQSAGDTNRRIDTRLEARSALDISAGILELSGDTATLEAIAAGGPYLINSATGEFMECTDPNREGCVNLTIEEFPNGANNLVTVTAEVGSNCGTGECETRTAIRDTFRERSLLDFILHSDSEALEDSATPTCSLPASLRPSECRQAAWNSILPAPSPQAIIAPGMLIAYTAPGANPLDFANTSSPANLDSNLTPNFTSSTGDYTVVAVINPDQVATGASQRVFAAQTSNQNNSGFWLGLDSGSSTAVASIGTGTSTLGTQTLPAAPITAANSNTIAAVVNSGDLYLYANGTRSSGTPIASGAINFDTPQAGVNYAGTIAFQTFPTALTNTEIAAVAASLTQSVPTGWIEADGTSHLNATYPALAATLGTTYGGNATTFTVPDLTGRTFISQDTTQTEFDALGEQGGGYTAAVTETEMAAHTHTAPAHTHGIAAHGHNQTTNHTHSASTGAAGNHTHRVGWQGSPTGSGNAFELLGPFNSFQHDGSGFVAAAGNHSHTVSVASKTVSVGSKAATFASTTASSNPTGGDIEHDNIQPYLVTRWLIATEAEPVLVPGMVAPYLIDTGLPAGWEEANGQTFDSVTETGLYAAIGTTYGGTPSAFLTPNFAGRTPIGSTPTDARFAALGQTGGTKTVTLTEANLPAHSHNQNPHTHSAPAHSHTANPHAHSGSTNTAGNHTHQAGWDGSAAGSGNRFRLTAFGRVPDGNGFVEAAGNHNHSISIGTSWVGTTSTALAAAQTTAPNLDATGNNDGHNNVSPYATVRWMIATSPAPILQPGMLLGRADTSAGDPTSWITPNSTPLNRVDYDLFYSLIGDQYGPGDGSSTFDLPNFTGRLLIGHDGSDIDYDVLGELGGETSHTLTTSELPAHSHTQNPHVHAGVNHNHAVTNHNHTASSNTTGNHVHKMGWQGSPTGSGNAFLLTAFGRVPTGGNLLNTTGNHTHSVSIGASAIGFNQAPASTTNPTTPTNTTTGGNQGHNNLQPYVTLRWILATAPSVLAAQPDQIDQVFGPIHTNDDFLLICGSPTFTEVYVAGPAATAPYWGFSTGANCNTGAPEILPGAGGFQPAEPLILPETEDWLDAAKTLPGTKTFTGDTTITLTGTTYTVSGGGGGTLTGQSLPPSGVIYVEGDTSGDPKVEVEGVMDGHLSIVTEGQIVLPGNITYACSALGEAVIPEECDDVLGLNAQNGIQIVYGSVVPGIDRTIHAAIAAVNGSVRVDRWASAKPPAGISAPTLYIGGSIVAQYRGVYGAYDGNTGELRSGYRKYFAYDERFHVLQPPFFVSPAGTRWARVDTTDLPAGTT